MRICIVRHVTEEGGAKTRPLLEKALDKARRSDTEVNFKSVRIRPDLTMLGGSYVYTTFLNKTEIIEKVIEAEKDGYDAAIVNCFADPGVREARGAVNIPVVGPGEATMLFACLLGSRFAIIHLPSAYLTAEFEANIRLLGLEGRVIHNPIRSIEMSWDEIFSNYEPKLIVEHLEIQARKCVEDGAEVVIIGCTALSPACTVFGLNRVAGVEVPILDPVATALKIAEVIVDFRDKLGLPFISRSGLYALPKPETLKAARAIYGLETE